MGSTAASSSQPRRTCSRKSAPMTVGRSSSNKERASPALQRPVTREDILQSTTDEEADPDVSHSHARADLFQDILQSTPEEEAETDIAHANARANVFQDILQ